MAEDFSKGKRGPVIKSDPNKARTTIRLDADIIEHFKNRVHASGGGSYQTLINDVLCEYIHAHDNGKTGICSCSCYFAIPEHCYRRSVIPERFCRRSSNVGWGDAGTPTFFYTPESAPCPRNMLTFSALITITERVNGMNTVQPRIFSTKAPYPRAILLILLKSGIYQGQLSRSDRSFRSINGRSIP